MNDTRALRARIVATALAMNAQGINRGKSGNVSARIDEGFLITPSALPYEETKPRDIVAVDRAGNATGGRKPSSEWRFHRDIYAARPEVMAIVHTHAPFATTLACLDRGIPAFHYMIAVGDSLKSALALAGEVETLAEMYWRARQLGEPPLLTDAEMSVVLEKFRAYGQQDR